MGFFIHTVKIYFSNMTISMKPLNYTSANYALLGVFLLILNACNIDSNKNENKVTDGVATATNQQSSSKVELGDFDLIDTTLKTSVGKQIKICLPIGTKVDKPNFTVTTSKPPLYGTLTPSVSDNNLCFDYTPNTVFEGLDQFDCKVCLTSSGFCQEKTWYVDVKKEATKGIAKENSISISKPVSQTASSASVKPEKKKEEPKIVVPPPAIPARSTIFDPDKKNNDGYVPKNDN